VKKLRKMLSRLFWSAGWKAIGPFVERLFFTALLIRTANFTKLRWLGTPIRQNVFDLWTIQETIAQLRPSLIIETGTNLGGSSLFFGQVFDLMGTTGRVVTIDTSRQHEINHPRVTYLIGDSASREITDKVSLLVAECAGPVLVILDSDHSQAHVARELEAYCGFVTTGSWLLVQDSVIDVLSFFRSSRPGPLPAIHEFLARHPEFAIDRERCDRFLISDHPDGWLRRGT
jgi:cephalosporin hydroxylase